MKELRGADVAAAMKAKMIDELAQLKGYIPHLAIIRVGERPDDIAYERGAMKRAESMQLRCTSHVLDKHLIESAKRKHKKYI